MKADKEKIKEQKRIDATIKFYNFLNENYGFYTKKDLIQLDFKEKRT